jgi:hypothetical protein
LSDPKKETEIEYKKFLKDLGASTTYSFQIKHEFIDSLSLSKNFCLNMYKFKRGTHASPVQIRMYDHSGNLTAGWEQCYGDLKQHHLFDSVPIRRVSWSPTNYNLKLQRDLTLFEADSSQKAKILSYINSGDYTIILFYSNWLGWYAKDAIKRTLKYANANKNISLLYVNTANK